jgi:hypothetical protein
MKTTAKQGDITPGNSPITEQKGSILFMMFLLIVSGLTATVVGYRVKTADTERKAQLLSTYENLGGSFADSLKLGSTTAKAPHLSEAQKTFILAFETNKRARLYGLARVVETTDPILAPLIVNSLFRVNATEGAKTFRDTWEAYLPQIAQLQKASPTEPAANTGLAQSPAGRLNPRASRFARQYDRHIARDTEVKLFLYLRNNRKLIQN